MSRPDRASRLAFSTHSATLVPTPNCFWIDGNASGTAVWSTRIMALATVMLMSTTCGLPDRRCAIPPPHPSSHATATTKTVLSIKLPE